MKHQMIDWETFGTVPGCALVSLGAVFFDPVKGKLGKEFYTVVNRKSCEDVGLHVDAGTLKWWTGQGAKAREAFTQSCDGQGTDLSEALDQFTAFFKQSTGVLVYGNGNDFDKPILEVAYRAVGKKAPWAPYNGRCYRTLKQQFKTELVREGTAHNALDDAKTQARHLIAIAKQHGLTLV